MKAEVFIVSHNNEELGPWSLVDIVSKVKSGELTQLDYIFVEEKQDWVSILEFEPIAQQLVGNKPSRPPEKILSSEDPVENLEADRVIQKSAEGQPEYMSVEWYVLKGENKFGPFSYIEVVKMLQQKVVFEFDFAWNLTLKAWQRIADLEVFTGENIKSLKETLMPEISEIFFRRRNRRVEYGGTVLVHDNSTVWKGKGVEISAGGAGVIMDNSMVSPGQKLYLHFKPGDGVPPFNAVCEVVSKRYDDSVKEKNAAVRYGLKFVSINKETKGFLEEYTKMGNAA